MMRARVIAGLGASSACVAYTIERVGPPPYVSQRSHAVVAATHGDPARCALERRGIARTTSKLKRAKNRMWGNGWR